MVRSLSNSKYLLWRFNPQTGFREVIGYTGNIKLKPTGWKLERKLKDGEYC